ncbi:MAG: serine/threonine-protein kinase [Gemmatimonadaceae bacterium]
MTATSGVSMDSGQWRMIKDLFAIVAEADTADRPRMLAEAAPEIAAEVERLLAHLDGHGPLDRPVLGSVSPSAFFSPSLIGRNIGSYRVDREIGRGGMGTVYLASRVDGEFEQRVAIKTLRLGVSSPAIAQRFRQERQILAGLQHPHIASLLDGGVTTDGVPYLVLEYIDGQPIDDYCAEHQLSLAARIDLFRQVLDAVSYAHRQLIVHRDLKPSNILVTKDGVVKLVDFGIAKLLGAADGLATADGWQAFTAAYAAPEQVFGQQISTATDIYALGVVLYLLLSGGVPYDVLGRAPGEVLEIIRDVQPLPPSATVSTSAAVNRGFLRDDQLAKSLRGELDAIVLMALRKEPARRYQSATVFGDDLRAYLKGMPVSARPDTFGYRVGKLVRRRWPIAIGAAVGILALLGGTGIALWQARAARDEARRAAIVTSFLQGMISSADVSGEARGARLGPGASVEEFVDSAVARLPIALRGDPRGEMSLHVAFGKAYFTQERFRDALTQFDTAIAIGRRLDGENSISVAQGLLELGLVESSRGRNELADSLLSHAVELYEQHDSIGSVDGISALASLGAAKAYLGIVFPAESLMRRALALENARNDKLTVTKASMVSQLGGIISLNGKRPRETDSLWHHAVLMFDSLPNGNVTEKGIALWYEAMRENANKHAVRAESLGRVALTIHKRAAGPRSQSYANQLANLASNALGNNDTASANAYVSEALRIIAGRAETNPIVKLRAEIIAERYYLTIGDQEQAEKMARAALAEPVGTNPAYHGNAAFEVGMVLMVRHKYAEAESYLRYSADQFLPFFSKSGLQTKTAWWYLATVMDSTGRKVVGDSLRALAMETEPAHPKKADEPKRKEVQAKGRPPGF